MKSKAQWIKDSFNLSGKLLRQQIWPLLGLFLVSCFVNISGEDAMQLFTPDQESQRWILQLLMGLWDLAEGILLLVIMSWGIPKVRPIKAVWFMQQPFDTAYLGSFFAEYLRALAQVLMWGLLLILPGFYRYVQLIFVPLVAFFAKDYRMGNADALRLSERIARGRFLLIAFVLIFTMALEVGVEFTPQLAPGLHTVVLRIVFAAMSFLISVWTYSLIFLMFESAMQEISEDHDGSHI